MMGQSACIVRGVTKTIELRSLVFGLGLSPWEEIELASRGTTAYWHTL